MIFEGNVSFFVLAKLYAHLIRMKVGSFRTPFVFSRLYFITLPNCTATLLQEQNMPSFCLSVVHCAVSHLKTGFIQPVVTSLLHISALGWDAILRFIYGFYSSPPNPHATVTSSLDRKRGVFVNEIYRYFFYKNKNETVRQLFYIYTLAH